MTAELTSVTDALEALTDIEVRALKTAASEAPAVANGLLVWLEGACDSEINRRFGRDYDLLPPQRRLTLARPTPASRRTCDARVVRKQRLRAPCRAQVLRCAGGVAKAAGAEWTAADAGWPRAGRRMQLVNPA
jgi:hypothetical protein